MEEMNSREYWDNRFKTDSWAQFNGKEQSVFFAKVAVSSFPNWFVSELSQNEWEIVDYGCAQGDGTAYLAQHFPSCSMTGVDISEEAVRKAAEQHPFCQFKAGDITEHVEETDVVFSSNTLEHLKNPKRVLKELVKSARKYAVLMLPLEDNFEIDEHFHVFETSFFPMRIDDHALCCMRIIDRMDTGIENGYWLGKQIFVIYVNTAYKTMSEELLTDFYKANVLPLQETRNTLLEQIEQQKTQLAQAKAEADAAYETVMTELEKERENTRFAREEWIKEHEVQLQTSQTLIEEKEHLHACQERLLECEYQLQKSQERLQECEQQLQASKEASFAYKDQLQASEALVENYKEKLQISEITVEDCKEQLQMSEATILECEGKLKVSEAVVEDYKEKLEASEAVVEDYKEKLQISEITVEDCKGQLQMSEATILECEEKLKASEAVVEDYKEKLEASEAVVEDYKERLEASEAVVEDCKEQLQMSEATILECEEQLQTCEESIHEYEEQLQEANDRAENLEEELKMVSERAEEYERQLHDCEVLAQDRETQLYSGRVLAEDYWQALERTRQQLAEQQNALIISENKVEDQKRHLSTLQERIAQMETNAASLEYWLQVAGKSEPMKLAHFLVQLKHAFLGTREERKECWRWLRGDRSFVPKYSFIRQSAVHAAELHAKVRAAQDIAENAEQISPIGATSYDTEMSNIVTDSNIATGMLEFAKILEEYPGRTVIVLPELVDWNIPLFQRPQQLAMSFAEKGILFVYFTPNGNDNCHSVTKLMDNVVLMPPEWFDQAIAMLLKQNLDVILDIWSTDNKHFMPWIERYRELGCRILYEYIDEISDEITGKVPRGTYERHHALLEDTDIAVVATADKLYDDVLNIRGCDVNCINSGNGVDLKHFRIKPDSSKIPASIKRLIRTKKPIIGYFGAIANWFDFEMVAYAAKHRPNYEFMMIGPHYGDHDLSCLEEMKKLRNLHFVGTIEYKKLPHIANHFTVATIPFLLNDITESTSPIKLFEYMAMGQPVVTTAMRECFKYPVVRIAKSNEDFVVALDEAVQKAKDEQFQKEIAEVAERNSWLKKAEELCELLDVAE